MAKLHIKLILNPDKQFGYVEVTLRARPNQKFNAIFEIWSAKQLEFLLEEEVAELEASPEYSTDVYDHLIKIKQTLEDEPYYLCNHKGFAEIFVDKSEVLRQDVEVILKEVVQQKGFKVGQTKWIMY